MNIRRAMKRVTSAWTLSNTHLAQAAMLLLYILLILAYSS